MAWFDKHKWSRHRAEQEREALAASVEELTTREQATAGAWEEEEEERDVVAAGRTALIPPRLHLQSRPLPIVRIDVTKHVPMRHDPLRAEREPENVAPLTEPVKRLGRSTKVRLQAVRPGQEPTTERVPVVDTPERPESELARDTSSTRDRPPSARRIELPGGAQEAAESASPPSALFCGSGTIEAGQEDATIYNPRISAQSVVTVMLAGNPGPVVVHYISLQPRAGFTLHLSAPVNAATPFNYAVWLF